jgi:3-phosphoshikimate 1-carboxyvinyltransferase
MQRIQAATRPLRGELTVPGDKSISHRAIIFAAISDGESRITNFSGGEDNQRTIQAFKDLGVSIGREARTVEVEGRGWEGLRAAEKVIDCGNSGTTMRLLAGVLAGRPFASVLDGDSSLRARPMRRIMEPLTQMGGEIQSGTGDGLAPLRIQGGKLRGVDYRMPIASAQVKSSILLAGMQASGITVVTEPQKSRDHTEIMARLFGGKLKVQGLAVAVEGGQRLKAQNIAVPGDLSSAAFFLVAAAAVPASELVIRNVGCNPTRAGILELLKRMGAVIEFLKRVDVSGEPVADLRIVGTGLHGIDIGPDMVTQTIDEYPILFVAAALAEGVTTVSGARELRYKESDRIAVMVEALRQLGAGVEEREDGLRIEGGRRLHGASVKTHGDHRVAMSLAIAGLSADGGVQLDDGDCADISFPGFFDLLQEISG